MTTARKWKVVERKVTGLFGATGTTYQIDVDGGDGERIALLGTNQRDNARLIVDAVNSRDEIRDALQLALATIDRLLRNAGYRNPSTGKPYDSCQGTRDVINAAIRKAGLR